MRPKILYPLFAPVTTLPGIGPRIGAVIARLAGPNIVDLLWHLPSAIIDRSYAPTIAAAQDGRIATISVTVLGHHPPNSARQPYKVVCGDGTGEVDLVFFHAREDYLRRLLPEGARRLVSGKVENFQDRPQIVHPDHVTAPEDAATIPRVEPVYPLTAGLTPKQLSGAIRAALSLVPALPEWDDPAFLARQRWPGWKEALLAVHAPAGAPDLDPAAPARQRLAYDELLANQLALALVRARLRRRAGRSIRGDGGLSLRALGALPFALTDSQQRALQEILADMASEHPMVRLLQGDVGSGKTVVALLAMLNAVEAGCQAALMAPTEILARQHFATIEPLAEVAGVSVILLTGRDKAKARRDAVARLVSGETDIAVGTHALFQEDVTFHDLALVVVDEQHRFGVHQRLQLAAKGRAVDMLVMTATPIPRSLMMTAYGDLDASRLLEKPAGRQPVDTRVLPLDRLADVVDRLDHAIAGGARVFWICPLVDESAAVDLAAATERHAVLRERLGPRVGLVHGRMKAAEKDDVMTRFSDGRIDVLVATTVVEVGVDVPEATVMVIEHAERFGLAQLHQLRGRVGRGERASTCLLLYQPPLGETARARLNILRETDDGFRIAEEDLRLRGAGELLGTRQSGLPEFRMADLGAHGTLLAAAADDAKLIVATDPELAGKRGEALRTLLYLFEEDQAVRTRRSG